MEAKKRNESAFGETEVQVFPRMINHVLGILSSSHSGKVCVSFGVASPFSVIGKNVFTRQ